MEFDRKRGTAVLKEGRYIVSVCLGRESIIASYVYGTSDDYVVALLLRSQ